MRASQPNFLIVMADQLAARALPVYSHAIVKAPHIMALGESGVVFDAAYCPSPLCAPSRAALLAGQLPSRIGVFDNAAEFPAAVPTFLHHLRLAGYRTCLAGKMHFVGPDQLHGFEERITTDIYPADFDWTPDWSRPEHRPSWYHSMLSVVQAGPCVRSNSIDYDEEVAFTATRWLYDLAREPAPFCLVVSFTQPHDPYTISDARWARYEGIEIDLPSVPAIPFDRLDAHSRRLHQMSAVGAYRQSEERIRGARRAYYGMISYVDDRIGEILAALRAGGLEGDTIVVLTSDHGDFLGERGLWYKMSFLEPSARVPLIVHAPERFAARRVATPVSLLDLFPTVLELAQGGALPELAQPSDGVSLRPALEGGTLTPQVVVGEYLAEGAIAPCFMRREGRFKFIHSAPDPDQLYDLEADPHELDNLAGRPAHAARCRAFRSDVERRWDGQELHDAVLASQRRRRVIAPALARGRRTAWDHQPDLDASRRYVRTHMPLDDIERRARFPQVSIPAPDA